MELYDESIKFLHIPPGIGGFPWYGQTEPMHFISITFNSAPVSDFFIFYDAPDSTDLATIVTTIDTTLLSQATTFVYDLPFKNGFALNRLGNGGDVTIAYRGSTIILP